MSNIRLQLRPLHGHGCDLRFGVELLLLTLALRTPATPRCDGLVSHGHEVLDVAVIFDLLVAHQLCEVVTLTCPRQPLEVPYRAGQSPGSLEAPRRALGSSSPVLGRLSAVWESSSAALGCAALSPMSSAKWSP